MKTQVTNRIDVMRKRPVAVFAGIMTVVTISILLIHRSSRSGLVASGVGPKPSVGAIDAMSILLVPPSGTGRLVEEVRRVQDQIRSGRGVEGGLERLGWLYVARGRENQDPGFYKMAEQCASALEARDPKAPEALLLKGHVLHNLHAFKDAEVIARELVKQREMPADYGLLGDALMEQGKLDEAIIAYQQMADLKPDLHASIRAAHLRWLKGDLIGAIELARDAAVAASPRDPDTASWVWTRLGAYLFQSGQLELALQQCADVLALRKDYPPALLLRGRILLADGKTSDAVVDLTRAAQLAPLPEYQWALVESLTVAGQSSAAAAVETELKRRGAGADPRTYSVFLSTKGESTDVALRLAVAELGNRSDVFTHDAVAWALAAAGEIDAANKELDKVISVGTQDARLFLHAALIRSRGGRFEEAANWHQKASALKSLLLPSEKQLLQALATQLGSAPSSALSGPHSEGAADFARASEAMF